MVSAGMRNALGGVCITFLVCGLLVLRSSNPSSSTILSTDTVVYSEVVSNEKSSVSPPKHPQFTKSAPSKDTSTPAVLTEEVTEMPMSSSSTTISSGEATSVVPLAGETSPVSSSSTTSRTLESSRDASSTETTLPLNLTKYAMDFELSDDLGSVLKARRSHVYKTCKEHQQKIRDSIVSRGDKYTKLITNNRNVLTDHNDGLTFCSVAKSGSTFWKSVFIYMATGNVVNGLAVGKWLDDSSYRSILSWGLAQYIGENYTSFVAVRNPWKRLVSLYQQKIEAYLPAVKKNGYKLKKGMAPYKYMLSVCGFKRQPKRMLTFSDMVDCVLKRNEERKPNRHWQAAYEFCNICNMNFSYVIRIENMMKEGSYVMEQAGLNNANEILSTVRNSTIRDVEKHKHRAYGEYYRDIHPTVIEKLRDTYKWEIELFGYPDTPFTT